MKTGLDPDHLVLSKSRDYVLRIPSGGLHGTLQIDGGHNVVLIGGSITVPSTANQSDNGTDGTDTAIYVTGSTGTVHIEGVLIGADPNVMYDGIDVNAPLATVNVENVRMTNVWGSETSQHSDVIQTWGGVRDLRVDRLTAAGDYQGLTIKPDLGLTQSAQLRNVDLTLLGTPPPLAASTKPSGYMLWLTRGVNSCQATSTTLSGVYVIDQAPGIAPSNTLWPPTRAHTSLPCAGELLTNTVTWPKLPVVGKVTLGVPPGGSFVPPGIAGNAYKSPGYTSG